MIDKSIRQYYQWGGPGGKSPGTSASHGQGGQGQGRSGALQQIAKASAQTARPPQLGGSGTAAQAAQFTGVPLGRQQGPVTTGGASPFAYTKPPVRTGGPPSILNPQPFNYGNFRKNLATSPNTLWNKLRQHIIMTEGVMKGRRVKDYHQLGAHDFMQRFNINPTVAKGLATLYQYTSELGRQFMPINQKNIYTALGEDLRKDKPFEPLGAIIGSISDALSRAKEESRLNREGIEGLTGPQLEVYNQLAEEVNPALRKMVST